MASRVVLTFSIMPESVEVNLEKLAEKIKEIISKEAEVGKIDYKPVAFGLKSIEIMAIMDESKGSTEKIEQEISELEGVSSAEVTDVRRTVDV
ncbi:MAG: elongation factor 1-beta [Candidatus Nanoarchaeia archaeon]|nr:elongation factor 1-beta [Candidatus Nanoarchaeia archaeon]MDD5054351.1 elongation factor 1-beta [Candidatus Nanoarchaeia archaeon]MDD5499697.1 elongation factor 1-beta [Candidatus Nanoarchaeia archaeon]